jgi:threonine synthase
LACLAKNKNEGKDNYSGCNGPDRLVEGLRCFRCPNGTQMLMIFYGWAGCYCSGINELHGLIFGSGIAYAISGVEIIDGVKEFALSEGMLIGPHRAAVCKAPLQLRRRKVVDTAFRIVLIPAAGINTGRILCR